MTNPRVFGFDFAVITFSPVCLAAVRFLFFDLCTLVNTVGMMSVQRRVPTPWTGKGTWLPPATSVCVLPSLTPCSGGHTSAGEWRGATDAGEISLHVVVVLGGLVLEEESMTMALPTLGEGGPRWNPVWELCLLRLWAFLSSALWRVCGNMTCKDSLWKGDRGLGVVAGRPVFCPFPPVSQSLNL